MTAFSDYYLTDPALRDSDMLAALLDELRDLDDATTLPEGDDDE